MIFSAVACVLLTHQTYGSSSVDILSNSSNVDPKLGVPLLLVIQFYNHIFSTNTGADCHEVLVRQDLLAIFINLLYFLVGDFSLLGNFKWNHWRSFAWFYFGVWRTDVHFSVSKNVQLKLLEMLPLLASHPAIIPLIIQTLLPMLQNDKKPYVDYYSLLISVVFYQVDISYCLWIMDMLHYLIISFQHISCLSHEKCCM